MSARWEGTELANALNNDSELASMLYNEGLDSIHILPSKGQKCVKIIHNHSGNENQFPSAGAFQAMDRIALKIKRHAQSAF